MHILAAREALERFANELPQAANADRLSRLATTTRSLFDQALAEADPGSQAARVALAWADHNLAVLLADALSDPQLLAPAKALYLGLRRRLIEALDKAPDDASPALALALGVAQVVTDRGERDDARLAADLAALGAAMKNPHVGARLVSAAVHAVVAASHSGAQPVHEAAVAAAPQVQEALDRLDKRVPNHPTLSLERCRLLMLSARNLEGAERKALIGRVRGLLSDHEARFGPSAMQRDVQATLVQLAAKDEPASDLARDALKLMELDRQEQSLDLKRATRLVRTLARAKALTAEVARRVQKTLGLTEDSAGDGHTLAELKGLLFSATGDEAALVSLQEKALTEDPNDHQAARTLFERLLRNLRNDLPSPFSSTTVDLILSAVPFPALGRLSADDIDALNRLIRETFGASRALTFARHKLTVARDLKGKDFVWKRALLLAEEVGDPEAQLDLARRALKEGNARHLGEARLMLARQLLARGEDLDEADDALKPLTSERGPMAAEAQQLKAKIKADPRYRSARIAALMAFEEQLGIGTARQHPLRVVFTSPGYLLAEVVEKPAPDFYEHRHLRVMIRAEDLPGGVKPPQLQKGDGLEAPIRGQDASPERDKEGLRIYWVSDPKRIQLAADPKAIEGRLEEEDAAFGVGTGRQLPLRVAWDGRKKRLTARLYDEQGQEFRARPRVEADNLPDGMEPPQCGQRGKRMTGAVERAEGGHYRVVGKLTLAPKREGEAEGPEPSAQDGQSAESDQTPQAEAATSGGAA